VIFIWFKMNTLRAKAGQKPGKTGGLVVRLGGEMERKPLPRLVNLSASPFSMEVAEMSRSGLTFKDSDAFWLVILLFERFLDANMSRLKLDLRMFGKQLLIKAAVSKSWQVRFVLCDGASLVKSTS